MGLGSETKPGILGGSRAGGRVRIVLWAGGRVGAGF